MQGIDISSYQAGINLNAVPFDFCIVKVTQGDSWNDKCCPGFVSTLKNMQKPFGVYHYVGGSSVEAEAQHFVQKCIALDVIGKGVLILDWEEIQNQHFGDTAYLTGLTKRVIELTGIPPIIYSSKAYFPWGVAKDLNCGTWVAQYASEKPTGYQKSPWNESMYDCTIRQYSANGKLSGWNGYLDLDKAYISEVQWAKYANPGSKPATSFDVAKAAFDTIRGKYGSGLARRNALGTHYTEVQAKVNELYKKANDTIKGKYGNGQGRRNALGSDYDAVQYIVNEILK